MTVYLVWLKAHFMDDRDQLQAIYDNKKSAEEHAKRSDSYDIEEYEVLTKDCFAYNRTGRGD